MNGRQLTTEELKQKELEILWWFHNYCEENRFHYCLAGGSLIGAIRHKGFIPWDDDIDVYMFRRDYMKLIATFPQEGIAHFKLLTPFTDPGCPITFGKLYDTNSTKYDNEVEKKYQLYGVDIDIYPLDYISSEIKERNAFYRKQYLRFKVFLGIVGQYRQEQTLSKTVLKRIYMTACKIASRMHILNANKIALSINRAAMSCDKSIYVCSSMQPLSGEAKNYAKTISFEERILVPFEDRKIYIPKGYDEYLTNTYGDYMKLPPKDQQVTHHLSNVYMKE